MRCINCGWDNPEGMNVCTKCGQSLGGNSCSNSQSYSQNVSSDAGEQRKTVIGAAAMNEVQRPTVVGAAGQEALRSTVIGNPVNAEVQRPTIRQADVKETPAPVQESLTCPKCGYPILNASAGTCPNCGESITKKEQSAAPVEESIEEDKAPVVRCQNCNSEIPANSSFCPNCGNKVQRKTQFRRYRDFFKEEPKKEFPFSLTLIPEEGENIEAKECSFKYMEDGDPVILNRSNTDATNRSITSGEQAQVTYEDGRWYLKNLSENESTLILANRKMELEDGDIILLGYRYFKFSKK